MKIRRKIRPPKTHSRAVLVDASTITAEYDFKYAKIVFDTRRGYIEVKPEWADDQDIWFQCDLVDKHGESICIAVDEFNRFVESSPYFPSVLTSICIAVDEFDRFRVRNAIGCFNDPFNREELMKSEQAEAVRRLVSNAYLELNERSFSILDSLVSVRREVRSDHSVPVGGGFIFYNWMPSSWMPSSTEFLEYPGLRSLYKTNNILTKKKGRHSRGRCGYQGRKPR